MSGSTYGSFSMKSQQYGAFDKWSTVLSITAGSWVIKYNNTQPINILDKLSWRDRSLTRASSRDIWLFAYKSLLRFSWLFKYRSSHTFVVNKHMETNMGNAICKRQQVTSMWKRSGSAVVSAGASRRFLHYLHGKSHVKTDEHYAEL